VIVAEQNHLGLGPKPKPASDGISLDDPGLAMKGFRAGKERQPLPCLYISFQTFLLILARIHVDSMELTRLSRLITGISLS